MDYNNDKKYFVFDTERYKGDLNDKAFFQYIEDRTITGYKLFLKQDFLTKVHIFISDSINLGACCFQI